MKRLSVVGAMIGSFLLGAAITAAAQEEEHTQQEEHRQEPAKPQEHKNQESKQDERQMKQPQQEQQKRDKQQEKQQEKMDKQQGQEKERHDQAQPHQPIQGGGQARPQHGQNARHITDHDFRTHFGREHRFAPGRMQVYEGRPSFSYSGYVFELVDVWPTDWAYDSDDYYVDYFDDEYWLCSFSYPDIRLELIIVE